MPTWQEIWEARRLDPSRGSLLAQLLAADGLDTGFGSVTEDAWREYVDRVARTLGIGPDSSVFEVGCGAGAFLYDLAGSGCTVSGIDASATQIGLAREAIPQGSWSVAEANRLQVHPQADYVVASTVFLYFPSPDYAVEVLDRMLQKARLGIAILDIPDAAKQESALVFRRGHLGPEEYARRYEGLSHLYLDKAWLAAQLRERGITRWHLEDQAIPGYANSAWRFNLFAWI